MATISAERLAANLKAIRERMTAAARRAGRNRDAVRLVAVTKTVDAEDIAALAQLGQVDFGESRVQTAREKQMQLADLLTAEKFAGLQWHLIGALQRNKVNLALKLFNRIHSIDSAELAAAVGHRMQSAPVGEVRSRWGPPSDWAVPVYLEVNVSGESTKRGVSVAAARELAPALAGLPMVGLQGLMTLAPYGASEAELRRIFSTLRELRDALRAGPTPSCQDLSMGMTDDFEIAIEEGATHVRVGRALTE